MGGSERKRELVPVRFKGARVDASVESISRRIERDYKLPSGSVALLRPSGRRARSDCSIGTLLRQWDW